MLNSELEGFEVFIPSLYVKSSAITLTIGMSGCRLSKPAMSNLKFPEYINVFFDRKTKRLMVTPADKRTPNGVKLVFVGKTKLLCRINMTCFNSELEKVCERKLFEKGKTYQVEGRVAKSQQPSIIFDLNKIYQTKGQDK